MGTYLMAFVTEATFPLLIATDVEIKILCVKTKGKCGVVSEFPYNVLLNVDLSRTTPFLIELRNLVLVNLGSLECFTIPLFLVGRSYKARVIALEQNDADCRTQVHPLHNQVTKRHSGGSLTEQSSIRLIR